MIIQLNSTEQVLINQDILRREHGIQIPDEEKAIKCGTFGCVYNVRDDNIPCILKITQYEAQSREVEISLLASANNLGPRIYKHFQFEGVYVPESEHIMARPITLTCLVMEKLFMDISDNVFFDTNTVQSIYDLLQIKQRLNIVHNDLHLGNIMGKVGHYNAEKQLYIVQDLRIIDWGMAYIAVEPEDIWVGIMEGIFQTVRYQEHKSSIHRYINLPFHNKRITAYCFLYQYGLFPSLYHRYILNFISDHATQLIYDICIEYIDLYDEYLGENDVDLLLYVYKIPPPDELLGFIKSFTYMCNLVHSKQLYMDE